MLPFFFRGCLGWFVIFWGCVWVIFVGAGVGVVVFIWGLERPRRLWKLLQPYSPLQLKLASRGSGPKTTNSVNPKPASPEHLTALDDEHCKPSIVASSLFRIHNLPAALDPTRLSQKSRKLRASGVWLRCRCLRYDLTGGHAARQQRFAFRGCGSRCLGEGVRNRGL